jgi:succinate dehydrogenase flavin-adding protein (antitoxin of CptAB toxin-antitoxin module)
MFALRPVQCRYLPKVSYCAAPKHEGLRKKLKWRSMERGMAENEIILRKYIDQFLPSMELEELTNFSDFLDELDPDMYKWFSGQTLFPVKYGLIERRVRKITGLEAPTFNTFSPVWGMETAVTSKE